MCTFERFFKKSSIFLEVMRFWEEERRQTGGWIFPMRSILSLFGLCGFLCLMGCPSQQVKKDDKAQKVVKKDEQPLPRLRPKPLPGVAQVPKNVHTFRVKKGIPFHAYLHADGTLRNDAPKNKDWKPVMVGIRGKRSWFAKLKPDAGVKVGAYVVIHVVLAVYAGAAGYSRSARFRASFAIRRGEKETELISSMLIARGNRYAVYRVFNVEIAPDYQLALKEGDLLVFRLQHRKGPTAAVGVGGNTGPQGSQVVLSPNEIGNYYQFGGKKQ